MDEISSIIMSFYTHPHTHMHTLMKDESKLERLTDFKSPNKC